VWAVDCAPAFGTALGDVEGRIVISVGNDPARSTDEGFLVGPVAFVEVAAAVAGLGNVPGRTRLQLRVNPPTRRGRTFVRCGQRSAVTGPTWSASSRSCDRVRCVRPPSHTIRYSRQQPSTRSARAATSAESLRSTSANTNRIRSCATTEPARTSPGTPRRYRQRTSPRRLRARCSGGRSTTSKLAPTGGRRHDAAARGYIRRPGETLGGNG
jgi:hypothetical protein